jgi:plastocyanin
MRLITLGSLLMTLLGSMLSSALGLATAQPNPTLNVAAGYGAAQVTVEEFFPQRIRIAEGTTVTWTQRALREHTVTFLAGQPRPEPDMPQPEDAAVRMKNPLAEFPTLPTGPYDGSSFINSGLMDQGETFSVTFAKAGNYPFVCLPRGHESMTGTVEVVPSGTAGITSQSQVDELTAREFAQFDGQVAEIFATRSRLANLDNVDGTRTWFVRNGSDFRDEENRIRINVRAFLPNPLTIARGDTVVWFTDSRVPVHTITFPAQEQPPAPRWSPRTEDGELVPLEWLTPRGRYRGDPNSLAWPRIVEDPTLNRFTRPSSVYDPTQLFSSGPMGDGGPTIGRAFSLTFEQPGTFVYFCVPHVEIGQIGQITVE